ncbi:MAG: ParA family protein [Xanthomonadales bacterium]|nr:ParA family protein [Xanthomonadales bacterium]NNL96328.1 ParA family protein [Xanthomonadales bacterium]
MARIIAVANQKGGVGKTTTCVNLVAALADMHYRTLLVDFDSQGNATVGCGVNPRSLERSAYDVMTGQASVSEAIIKLPELGFDLLPSNSDLTAAEVEMMQQEQREYRLQQALDEVAPQYGWIVIDCPPSLNMLTLNALTAANSVLIPIQCEYYALEGLASLLETIEQVRASVNPGLEIEGLLRTMFDVRNNLSSAVSDQLEEHFGEQVYRTMVPRNVRVAEAPSHGVPVLRYDPGSRGALAYIGLAGEILRRRRKREAG